MAKQMGTHRTRIISAICTPMHADQSLHVEALEMHLEDQLRAGFAGLLVGGTMGLMQLLPDATHRQLVEVAVNSPAARDMEVLVGVGDTSFGRTRDRIAFVQQFDVDGVVVITPSFFKFNKAELLDYYTALADFSRKPVFLYDLPVLTGVKLDNDLIQQVCAHPNVAGIKCSFPWEATRMLMDLVPPRVRVIPAQALIVDQLIRLGVRENLDGIYPVVPALTAHLVEAAEAQRWDEAAALQSDLSAILRLLIRFGVFAAATAILNARGIPGNMAPAPLKPLTEAARRELLEDATLMKHIAADRVCVAG